MQTASASSLNRGLNRELYLIGLTIAVPALLVSGAALWFSIEVVKYQIAISWATFFTALLLITLSVGFGIYRVTRIVRSLQATETQMQMRNQQLITADRLASVGIMAASIAHEVNNPLTTIKILIHALKEQLPTDEQARTDLEVIQGEIDKIGALVLRLMQFARPTQPELVVADLNLTLGRVVDLIRPQAQMAGIGIHDHRKPLPPVLADPAQLGQVFLNILLNAVDATPQGGTIKVLADAGHNDDVIVTIWNSGKGLDPSLYDRIFDPFFTTKTSGTGLGLSIAHMIMDKHKGAIRAMGHGDSGTSFQLMIPRATFVKS